MESAVTCLARWAVCLVRTGMFFCSENPCTQAHSLNWSRAEFCSRDRIEGLAPSEAAAALRGKPTVCPTPPPWIVVVRG